MKKAAVFLILIIFLLGNLWAQETNILEYFSEIADNDVSLIQRNLRNGGELYISDIGFNGDSSSLGDLFSSVLLSRLTYAGIRNLSLFDSNTEIPENPNSSVYILSGELFRLSDVLYMSISLKKGENGQVLMVQEHAIPLTRDVSILLAGNSGGGTSGGDSFEPNNEPSLALSLELNSEFGGLTLEPSGDQDWFVIEVAEAGENFLSVGTTGSLDTVMELYGPDDPGLLIVSNDDVGEDSNASVQTSITEPGLYYIKVSGYDSETRGSYGLYSKFEEWSPEEGEPNNDMGSAETIPGIYLSYEKQLFPMGDEDWYLLDLSGIELVEGESVRVRTKGLLDTYMELYQDGSMVYNDDDSGSDGNASVVFDPVPGAEYKVLVRGYSSADLGPYELEIDTMVVELDEYEPNNSMDEATLIELNSTQSHSLFMSDEIDWFTFTLENADNINFETYGDMDTYVIMYDSQGNTIQESDDDGTGYNGKISMYLKSGVYYCTVTLYSSGSDVTEYTAALSSN